MAGRTIAGQRYPGDDGAADPDAAAALAAYAAGEGSERAALTALAGARLLVPVVAVPAGPAGPVRPADAAGADAAGADAAGADATGERAAASRAAPLGEKASEVALPLLVGRDGRKAMLAFTSLAALARWRPGARPVPVPAAEVWQAGVTDASAVVIDVAGPLPLTVEGARLTALAHGEPLPDLHEDPDLQAAVATAAAAEPLLSGAGIAAGGDGSDLTLRVVLAAGAGPGDPAVQAAIQRIAESVGVAAAGRLRRGLEVTVGLDGTW